MLFALSDLVEIPCHKRNDTEGGDDEQDEDEDEEGPAASRGSCIAVAERVVMVVMHLYSALQSSITAWIGWWVCINDDSVAGLQNVSAQDVRQAYPAYSHVVWSMVDAVSS